MTPTVLNAARRRFLGRGGAAAGGATARLLAPSLASTLVPSLATSLALFPALGLAPSPARARTALDDSLDTSPLDVWPSSFAYVPEQFGPTEARWSKRLPDGLAGVIYRNGPARMHRGKTHYRHWFDGDGMVHAFRFDAQTLNHRARMVRTDKYVAEEKAGRFLYPAFGTRVPDALATTRPDDGNVANISVLPVAGEQGPEVLALWEAGSPWRIDPQTLETRGRKVWSAETDGAAFSAHPKVDRDGTIWSFGYLPGSGRLVLYRIDSKGQLKTAAMVETADADMIHDFAITDRWLVFVLMPLVFDPESTRGDGSFLSRLQWQGEQRGGTVLLVDKSSLAIRHRFQIPATPFFHLGNAWDDGSSVRIQVMTVPGFDPTMEAILAAMQGRAYELANGVPIEITVRTGRATGTIRKLADHSADFPVYDRRFIAKRTRALFACAVGPSMPEDMFGFNAIVRIEGDSGRTRLFDYGAGVLAEEHLFVPRKGGREGAGWLVGTALDYARGQTVMSVFNAEAIDAGPISQARLPYGLPPGLHGAFVAS